MTTRNDLGAFLQTALGDDVIVYDYPAEQITYPAVVIQRTAIRPGEFGGPWALEWDFALWLVVSRATPDDAENALEELAMAVMVTLSDFHGARWSELGPTNQVETGEVESAAATLEITVRH